MHYRGRIGNGSIGDIRIGPRKGGGRLARPQRNEINI